MEENQGKNSNNVKIGNKETENSENQKKNIGNYTNTNGKILSEKVETTEKQTLNNSSSLSSFSSLSSSLDSLNLKNSGFVVPLENNTQDEMNNNINTLNITSPNIAATKAKATSSTILEIASSSDIVNSTNYNATSSILHIKNSSSIQSLTKDEAKNKKSHSASTSMNTSNHSKKHLEHKKKSSKGKHKYKSDEDQEIDDIRNSLNFSEEDLADAFMGLASSSVVNKNKNKEKEKEIPTDNNINNIEDINSSSVENIIKKKGKSKSKESKSESNINKVNYGKGPSAVVEGPYTVFHSSSSSSSLDFLLESAAVASSSHSNDEPPLNISLHRHLPQSQLSNSNIIDDDNDQESDNNEENSDNEGLNIAHLGSSSSSSLLGLRYTQKNLDDLLLKPVSVDQSIKCTLIRSKIKNVPSYELYIENTDSTFSLLLYSRKVRIGNHNEYVITRKVFTTNLPEDSEIIGRLKSNFVGTAFVLYDNNKKQVRKENIDELRGELGAVLYEPNILGFKGPRKMKIITTRINEQGEFIPCKPRHAKDTLIERSKDPFDREMLVLYNKAPQWNEETQSYVLNFNHRVRIASVKNFQIINNDDLDYIIMQFGKKKKNIFTLDFRYPFSALLAFAIALTSLDTKIACE